MNTAGVRFVSIGLAVSQIHYIASSKFKLIDLRQSQQGRDIVLNVINPNTSRVEAFVEPARRGPRIGQGETVVRIELLCQLESCCPASRGQEAPSPRISCGTSHAISR